MSFNDSYFFSVKFTQPDAAYLLSNQLFLLLKSKHYKSQPLIILCIGTDRSTGDCLGPLVGEHLAKFRQLNQVRVFGTLRDPIHAKNLEQKYDDLFHQYEKPFIIAVDASLGQSCNIGNINLVNGAITPGSGVNKNLCPVGDIGITGIVNLSGFMEYIILQNTRLSLVMDMADKISSALYWTVNKLQSYHSTIN